MTRRRIYRVFDARMPKWLEMTIVGVFIVVAAIVLMLWSDWLWPAGN